MKRRLIRESSGYSVLLMECLRLRLEHGFLDWHRTVAGALWQFPLVIKKCHEETFRDHVMYYPCYSCLFAKMISARQMPI